MTTHLSKPPEKSRLSFLVIDDDVSILSAICMLLTLWGHDPIQAESIEQGLLTLKSKGIALDVIISDAYLFESDCSKTMNDLCALMQSVDFSGPVIMITGDTNPSIRRQIQAAGWLLLIKPFSPDALHAAIIEALR